MTDNVFPSQYRTQLAQAIPVFLHTELSAYAQLPWVNEVETQLTQFCLGGKLARGTTFIHLTHLLQKTHPAAKRLQEATILAMGVGIELFGSALLIHDDIIDQDAVRRGIATIHTQYAQWAQGAGRPVPAHDGTSAAIVLGDVLLFLVNRALLQNLDPALDAATTRKLLLQFSRQALYTGFGELLDSVGTPAQSQPTEESVLALFSAKTAHYTLGMPFTLAAIASHQSDADVEVWDTIGDLLGTLFQIKDDEIGLFGDPNTTGKAVGADIRQNKRTLYFLYARDALRAQSSTTELQTLEAAYGNQQLDTETVDTVTKLIASTGARTALQERMEKIGASAVAQLEKLNLNAELNEWFHALVSFHLKRTK